MPDRTSRRSPTTQEGLKALESENRLLQEKLKELTDARPGASPIVQTAWNNRLAKLAELGALVEIPHGRAKRYRLFT